MNLSSKHQPRILAVFAHPDDETFCAGGTLAGYAAQGAEIMVVSATRGDAGQIHDATAATRRSLGPVRERELRLACRRLGVQHAVCLDYGDGTLEQVEPALLTHHIARIVRRFRPDIVITFGPDGAYGHPDHIAIGAATTAACSLAAEAAGCFDRHAGGLEPHAPQAVYHSYFPRRHLLLRDLLAQWLVLQSRPFQAGPEYVRALPLLANELSVLGCTGDHVEVQWYADGYSIVEQGEPASRLYLMLDGAAEQVREDDDGTLHPIAQLGPGSFFGQHDLDEGRSSGAHVVARGSATCLILAPGAPTAFAGRGAGGAYTFGTQAGVAELVGDAAMHTVDTSQYIEHKIAALAAHRTQCPVAPDMLPAAMFAALFGHEYFVRAEPVSRLEILSPRWAPTAMPAYRQAA